MEFDAQLIVFLLGVGIFTLTAAISDLRTRRIPNKLTVPFFFGGLIYQVVFFGLAGLGDGLIGFAIGFGTLFVLWMIGGGGGGDVKLMGALATWLGMSMTILVLIGSTFCVLAGTVLVMLWSLMTRGISRTKGQYLATGKQDYKKGEPVKKETTDEKKQRRIMAYALPVAIATWSIVLWKLPTL